MKLLQVRASGEHLPSEQKPRQGGKPRNPPQPGRMPSRRPQTGNINQSRLLGGLQHPSDKEPGCLDGFSISGVDRNTDRFKSDRAFSIHCWIRNGFPIGLCLLFRQVICLLIKFAQRPFISEGILINKILIGCRLQTDQVVSSTKACFRVRKEASRALSCKFKTSFRSNRCRQRRHTSFGQKGRIWKAGVRLCHY